MNQPISGSISDAIITGKTGAGMSIGARDWNIDFNTHSTVDPLFLFPVGSVRRVDLPPWHPMFSRMPRNESPKKPPQRPTFHTSLGTRTVHGMKREAKLLDPASLVCWHMPVACSLTPPGPTRCLRHFSSFVLYWIIHYSRSPLLYSLFPYRV